MKFFFIMVCSFLLCGCSSKMEGSAQVTQDNGEITTAKVILKDNKIQEVSIDETVADVDKTKKQLQNSYGMKQASSIGKEWYEQVLFFEDYVKTHGIENIKTDEKGKSVNEDLKTGCTIRVDTFIEAIKQAEMDAKNKK
ncbi:FMN-binding protein [Eubacterium sp. AM18-26]|nr:FMN-binding protein [Eubacterium sp. AM18-26]RHO24966.1 FMN-binding protein [Eubacterium sp. AM18-10LB-B]RHO29045.1 FMN-binding protein [Erysipelotrichaceae bacterium AM17-60]